MNSQPASTAPSPHYNSVHFTPNSVRGAHHTSPPTPSGVSFSVIPFSTPPGLHCISPLRHTSFILHFPSSCQRRTSKGHNPLRHTAKTALSPQKTDTTQRKAPLSTASHIICYKHNISTVLSVTQKHVLNRGNLRYYLFPTA